MIKLNRRKWLETAAAAWLAGRPASAIAETARENCTLSIGTYSLKGIAVEAAVKLVAEIGYDALEIAVQPGCGGTPEELTPARRQAVRRLIEAAGLRLTALMEHLIPSDDRRQEAVELDRLRRVMELGHALAPARRPLVQTVLGNGQWDDRKNLYRDRLARWVEIGKDAGMTIAVKPHRGSAMSRPEEAIWLIGQLGNTPWLRMVYDYSHYAFRRMPLEETVKTSLPYTAHVVLKDAVQRGAKVEFLPAGESGTFAYDRLLRLFYEGGYRGDVCCEVSSMVSRKPGYDPVATARACYGRMARAFEAAGVPRGTRR